MKNIFVFTLVILAVSIHATSAQSHNVTYGVIGSRDILLDSEILVRKYKFLSVLSEDYTYPRKGFENVYNITGIRCIDTYTNGNGGYCALKKGGPGKREVTINLKSQRNHGFNFIIQVYGQ